MKRRQRATSSTRPTTAGMDANVGSAVDVVVVDTHNGASARSGGGVGDDDDLFVCRVDKPDLSFLDEQSSAEDGSDPPPSLNGDFVSDSRPPATSLPLRSKPGRTRRSKKSAREGELTGAAKTPNAGPTSVDEQLDPVLAAALAARLRSDGTRRLFRAAVDGNDGVGDVEPRTASTATLTVHVRAKGQRRMRFKLFSADTVDKLRTAYCERCGLDAERYEAWLDDERLALQLSVVGAGVTDGAKLELRERTLSTPVATVGAVATKAASISLQLRCGSETPVVCVTSVRDPLANVLRTYCSQRGGRDVLRARLCFDGDDVDLEATAEQLELEDMDLVDVVAIE